MKRRRFAALAGATLLVAVGAPASAARGNAALPAPSEPSAAWLEGDGGQFTGVAVADDGTMALTAQDAAWSEAPFARAGAYVSPPLPLAEPTATLAARWEGDLPAGAAVRLEARGWEGERPTPWAEAPADGGVVTLAWPASAAQYRVSLLAMPDAAGPTVRGVVVMSVGDAAAPLAAAQAQPSAAHRLYATRIGLIGRTTANGTVIAPEDRFVALPSRRVLAARGSRDYEVRIEYKGRSVTIPVWDIGPWNVRDNYWDPSHRRDMWNDLPPGRPQSAAAYFEAYNGGRDGFGRRILSPASIDISDAAFYELGMTGADWVNVTLLWQAGR